MIRQQLLAVLAVLLLASCGAARRDEGPDLARTAGWNWAIVDAGSFDLAVAASPPRSGEILTVYLEGDGLAYVRPSQPARDPTPTDPVALRLAMADPFSGPVAWIGRPCQYTMAGHGRSCRVEYWTVARYAPEVVDSMNAAVDDLKRRDNARQVVLVGYSGGGALAVLLAARRHDVKSIATVVGDLDLDYWTRRDGLTPLRQSLDPAAVAASLGQLPQVHFTGGRDRVVGSDVVESYLRRLPPGAPARMVEIPDYTHTCCWSRDWRSLSASLVR